ncbi:MAG: serine/threonine-protein kinase [Candidatus Limnocylindrales bacterium]
MDNERIGDRYALIDRHAVGGMATIWRATDEWTGELVAIKRLHPHVLADPVARARLERESDALRAIDHPAIVRPRTLVDDPDAPALVMDFVEGRPLDQRIAEGPLPTGEALAIAAVVADALATAHDHGVVHRDIKPANILVDDGGTVHLVDFGIAALGDGATDDLTAASTMVGTLRYAAPERLAGEAASAPADVWSLGAVLYEMLTGSPAVPSNDPAGALAASRQAPPDLNDLAAPVAAVVAKAMAVDPADRYPDAIAFRDALLVAESPAGADDPTVQVSLPIAVGQVGIGDSSAPGPGRSLSSGRVAGRWAALVLAGVIAAAAAFALAAAGRSEDPGQSVAPNPASTPSITARPVAKPTLAPVVAPKPDSKPKGNDKGDDNGKGKDKDD